MKIKNTFTKYLKNFSEIPRYYFILILFTLFFLIILYTVFKYTIKDGEFYTQKADNQQIGELKVPVTRGSILSLSENWNKVLLATSLNLDTLAIDPTRVWDKKKLIWYLTNIIYRESCIWKSRERCINNLLKFTKKEKFENFIYKTKEIKIIIRKSLIKKLSQKYIESVLLAQELDDKIIEKIKKLNFKWVYPTEEWNLYINPLEIQNRKLISSKIAELISFPEETVFFLIRKRKVQYIHLLNKLSIEESSKLKNYIKDERNSINKWYLKKENGINSFIILTPHPNRLYPENSIWAQVIWFLDKSWKWHYWIEWYFNEILKWESGEIVSRKDIKWRTINPINLNKWEIEREWANIYTTIDRTIQKKVEQILELGVKKYNANKWSIIIMNPKNGQIISMANYPTFDPNNPWEVYELENIKNKDYKNIWNELIWKSVFIEDNIKWKEFFINWKKILLRKALREELWDYSLKKYKYKNNFGVWVYKNSIITDVYEPGSIMKSITMAIWIETWEITENTYYQNNWSIKIDNFKISDISKKCLWYHTFSWALDYSCNVWMVRIVQKIWKALLYSYLKDFWFWELTGISLDWEISLPILNYQKWSNAKLFSSSYGLWINTNQLQVAVAYSALANWGFILRPQIIEKIEFEKNKVSKFKKEIIRRVISEKTSNIMKNLLVNWIENWAAKNWKVEWYLLAGKTWTSQIAYKWRYEDWNIPGSTNASFAWFWPIQDPKFVIVIKLERPRTNNFWWSTSAFLFAETAEFLLNYYKIPKIK